MAPERAREPPPDTDNETELRIWRQSNLRHEEATREDTLAEREPRETRGKEAPPAPGEANPLSKKGQRPFDRREREP